SSSAALDTTRPDLFVHRLIERLGLRRQQLFAAQADVVERLVNLAKFGEMASAYVRRAPQATPREFARYIAAVADAGLREEEATGEGVPGGVRVMAMHDAKGLEFDHVYVLGLQSARMPGARRRAAAAVPDALLREELLETVARTAGRLGELRFDTDLDVSHAVVRYLELVKLAALIERPAGQSVQDALPEINARLARAVTAEQREIFQTSALDE